jgi:hypothetical protein
VPNPPRLRSLPVFPKGPRLYSGVEKVGGPGEPPPGFLTGPNAAGIVSAEEWQVYWALAKIYRDPPDPRLPPYEGARDGSWTYQIPLLGGRREPGGLVLDFICYFQGERVGLRLQTAYFHVLADSGQQAYDALQEATLSEFMRIEDVFSQDFIGADDNGQSAVIAVKNALQGIPRRDPILTGQGQQTRARA